MNNLEKKFKNLMVLTGLAGSLFLTGCETAQDTHDAGTVARVGSFFGVARGGDTFIGGVLGIVGESLQSDAQIQAIQGNQQVNPVVVYTKSEREQNADLVRNNTFTLELKRWVDLNKNRVKEYQTELFSAADNQGTYHFPRNERVFLSITSDSREDFDLYYEIFYGERKGGASTGTFRVKGNRGGNENWIYELDDANTAMMGEHSFRINFFIGKRKDAQFIKTVNYITQKKEKAESYYK